LGPINTTSTADLNPPYSSIIRKKNRGSETRVLLELVDDVFLHCKGVFVGRELLFLDFADEFLHRVELEIVGIGIDLHELGRKPLEQTQDVVENQNLAVVIFGEAVD